MRYSRITESTIVCFLFAWSACPGILLSFLALLLMDFAGIIWRIAFHNDFAIRLLLVEESIVEGEDAVLGEFSLSFYMFCFGF